jgi:hypothetical protein
MEILEITNNQINRGIPVIKAGAWTPVWGLTETPEGFSKIVGEPLKLATSNYFWQKASSFTELL